jgi:hypothetical protein
MESETRATILDKLAKQYRIRVFNPARWEEIELQHVLEGVENLVTLMGGAARFQSEMRALKQTVHISRVSWQTSAAAMALPVVDVVYFKRASWRNPSELKWQTVHELAHTWDMRRLLSLSRGLRRATGSKYGRLRWQLPVPLEYKPGGRWLEGRKPPLNSLEDWADSVATYVYQDYAEGRKRMISPIRWNYVRKHMQVKLSYPVDWIPYFY